MLKRITCIIAVIGLIFSCAKERLPTSLETFSAMENSLKIKGGYESYLALEYLTFARNLLAIKEEQESDYFAKKGLAVAYGKDFVPENPIERKADPSQMEEMVLMQKRLELVLDYSYIKFQLPIQTAHLTYLYDCWISRESSPMFRSDELAKCRVRYSKLLDEIESYIDDLKKDRQPKVVVKEPEFERFEIEFDLDNFKLSDKANKELIKVIKYLLTMKGDYKILVVGKADRNGSELYNQSLSFTRADIIKNYLIKNGVPENRLEMRALGENFPDLITNDGVATQLNRNVAIYLMKGFGSFDSIPLPLIDNEIYRKEIEKARVERGLSIEDQE